MKSLTFTCDLCSSSAPESRILGIRRLASGISLFAPSESDRHICHRCATVIASDLMVQAEREKGGVA